ncbi:MAG: M23 family metallopeptidase [Alphaproteobacteria bacterium]|nr:M23 family metallopeptidase [Alphaproteobacteria bacterium SS10]
MGIEEDELGEVENLSIFEKYPEAFKRLSILLAGVIGISVSVYLFATSEGEPDCPPLDQGTIHDEVCHGDMFCIQEIRSDVCVEFLVQKMSGGASIGLLVEAHEDGLIGSGDQMYLELKDDDLVRLYSFEFPDGPDGNTTASLSVMPQFGGLPSTPDNSVYVMPLPSERGFRVLQASDRLKDHEGMLEHAVDFQVPAGTPVRAMRDGFVVGMRMDQFLGGTRDRARGKENYIWIQHLDGTVATYRHLLRDSNKVEFGASVIAGQEIALSGATGYTEEPMLHVHVSTPLINGEGFKTFPMTFATTKGNTVMKTREIYKATF